MPTPNARVSALARRSSNESILLGIAGLVVGGAGNLLLAGDAALAITLVLVVVFMLTAALFTTTRNRALAEEVTAQVARLQLVSSWIYDPRDAKQAYDRASKVIQEARSSISVFSQYSPVGEPVYFSEGRAQHFASIEGLIRSKLKARSDGSFVYRRAIQHAGAMALTDTRIRADLFGLDKQLFDHCVRVFELVRGGTSTNVRVEFLLCEPTPSAPSVMVVDDDNVLVSLLTRELNPRTGSAEIYSGGLVFIDDRVGKTVEGFSHAMSGLVRDSRAIEPALPQ